MSTTIAHSMIELVHGSEFHMVVYVSLLQVMVLLDCDSPIYSTLVQGSILFGWEFRFKLQSKQVSKGGLVRWCYSLMRPRDGGPRPWSPCLPWCLKLDDLGYIT